MKRVVQSMARWPRLAAMGVLRGYQYAISPWLPPSCRFAPTCSEYAVQAVERFGLVRGAGLAAWRLLRCHPFHPGGYDPVPPAHGHGVHPTSHRTTHA